MLLPYLNKELIEAGAMRPVVGVWPVRFMPLLLSYQKILKMSC